MTLTKSSETAARILQAAYRRLASDGYARLNMRDVAAEAGVNHALIHYYFGSKDQLVIDVLDEANRRLLERQTQMYTTPGDFAAKWAQARAFMRRILPLGSCASRWNCGPPVSRTRLCVSSSSRVSWHGIA